MHIWYYRPLWTQTHQQSKWIVYLHLLNATLICALLSNRLVTLSGKVLKILMPAKYSHFWKQERLAFGLRGWSLFLVLIQCTGEVVWKFFRLFTIKFINENIHWQGTSKISISLNSLLHDVPGFAPTIILTIFFYEVHLLSLLDKFPKQL